MIHCLILGALGSAMGAAAADEIGIALAALAVALIAGLSAVGAK